MKVTISEGRAEHWSPSQNKPTNPAWQVLDQLIYTLNENGKQQFHYKASTDENSPQVQCVHKVYQQGRLWDTPLPGKPQKAVVALCY